MHGVLGFARAFCALRWRAHAPTAPWNGRLGATVRASAFLHRSTGSVWRLSACARSHERRRTPPRRAATCPQRPCLPLSLPHRIPATHPVPTNRAIPNPLAFTISRVGPCDLASTCAPRSSSPPRRVARLSRAPERTCPLAPHLVSIATTLPTRTCSSAWLRTPGPGRAPLFPRTRPVPLFFFFHLPFFPLSPFFPPWSFSDFFQTFPSLPLCCSCSFLSHCSSRSFRPTFQPHFFVVSLRCPSSVDRTLPPAPVAASAGHRSFPLPPRSGRGFRRAPTAPRSASFLCLSSVSSSGADPEQRLKVAKAVSSPRKAALGVAHRLLAPFPTRGCGTTRRRPAPIAPSGAAPGGDPSAFALAPVGARGSARDPGTLASLSDRPSIRNRRLLCRGRFDASSAVLGRECSDTDAR